MTIRKQPAYSEAYRIRHRSIRDINAIGAAADVVVSHPHDQWPMAMNIVRDEIGLNSVELEEVDRIARFIEAFRPSTFERSDDWVATRLTVIEAAQTLACARPERMHVVLGWTMENFGLGEDVSHRVVSLTAFFWQWPCPWLERYHRNRESRRAAALS